MLNLGWDFKKALIELNENNRDDIRVPINLPEVLPELHLVIKRDIGPELSQVTDQRRACNYVFWKINIFCCCLILLGFMTPLLLFAFFPDETVIILIIVGSAYNVVTCSLVT